MLAVKPFFQARLNKLVIAGALVELGDFVKAVNVAVTEARKLVDVSAWSYFSRIEKKGSLSEATLQQDSVVAHLELSHGCRLERGSSAALGVHSPRSCTITHSDPSCCKCHP